MSSFAGARAEVIEGNFNEHGYDVVNIHVASAATVDFVLTSGFVDATFSLFGANGSHLVSNDDSNSLDPRLTQNLAAGNYSLMIGYCCSFINALPGSTRTNSDTSIPVPTGSAAAQPWQACRPIWTGPTFSQASTTSSR